MNPAFLKCECGHCGVPIEFPAEMVGTTVNCPSCQTPTGLFDPANIGNKTEIVDAQPASISAPELLELFTAPVPRTRVSILYRFGLCVVTVAMLLLPLLYLALIGVAAAGVWYWATHFSSLLSHGVGG